MKNFVVADDGGYNEDNESSLMSGVGSSSDGRRNYIEFPLLYNLLLFILTHSNDKRSLFSSERGIEEYHSGLYNSALMERITP